MSPKLGQKIKDNPKNKLLQVRIDKETLEKLDCVVELTGVSRSEVVRKGIENEYQKASCKK